ncbi:uncharacterized protein [Watersipora subatra]
MMLVILVVVVGVAETVMSDEVGDSYGSVNALSCSGAFCGAPLLTASIVTVRVAKANNEKKVKLGFILSISGVVVSFALLIFSAVSISQVSAHLCHPASSRNHLYSDPKLEAIFILDCLMASLALAIMMLNITRSYLFLQSISFCGRPATHRVPVTNDVYDKKIKAVVRRMGIILFSELFLSIPCFVFGIIIMTNREGQSYTINARIGMGIIYGTVLFFITCSNICVNKSRRAFKVYFFLSNGLALILGLFMLVTSSVSLSLPSITKNNPSRTRTTNQIIADSWREVFEGTTTDATAQVKALKVASDAVLMVVALVSIGLVTTALVTRLQVLFLKKIEVVQVVHSQTLSSFVPPAAPREDAASTIVTEPSSEVFFNNTREPEVSISTSRQREPYSYHSTATNVHAPPPPYQASAPHKQQASSNVEDILPTYESLRLNEHFYNSRRINSNH